MLGVDQGRVGSFSSIVPLARSRFPTRILRGGDDFKVLIFQFRVQFLPAWQIEAASSPGCPGDNEDLFAPKVRQMDDAAFTVGSREIRREAGVEVGSTHDRDLAHAPDAGVCDKRFPSSLGKARQMEQSILTEGPRNGNADVRTAGPLLLQFEAIDARQIRRAYPELLALNTDAIQLRRLISK